MSFRTLVAAAVLSACSSDADIANAAHDRCSEYCRVVGGNLIEVQFELGVFGVVDTRCVCSTEYLPIDPE